MAGMVDHNTLEERFTKLEELEEERFLGGFHK